MTRTTHLCTAVVLHSAACLAVMLLVSLLWASHALSDPAAVPDADTTNSAVLQPKAPESESQQLLDALGEAPNASTAAHIERALLQAWLRSGSDTVDLLMARASEAMERNAFPVALELLTTVVEIKPDYPEGWNRRATLYYLMDEYALSVADIRHTLALEPRHFGALSGLGLILQSMGRKASALVAFEEALKVHPYLESASTAAKELEPEVNGIPM